MKRHTYSNAALKTVLLTDHYPDGNVGHLAMATMLSCSALNDNVTLHTNLPDDHWAFTCKEEPKPRYRLHENREDVYDSVTNVTVGFFHTMQDAKDYMAFRNDRLKNRG